MPGQPNIEDPAPLVRIEVVDRLPQGRLVARLEAQHDTVFAVVPPDGATEDYFPTFLCQLEGVMRDAVESGNWARSAIPAQQHSGQQ